ncbi:MAG: hypothetical protein WC618_01790 [Patescibacteria group bacterium]
MAISLLPFLAKIILRLNPFPRLMVVCRGYNEDFENFTELVWEDDKYLDFTNQESYPQFQLWYV